MLLTRPDANGGLEVTAVGGGNGAPVAGINVMLYRYDYGKGHHLETSAVTDAKGSVKLQIKGNDYASFVIARKGDQVAIDPQYQYVNRERPERGARLVRLHRPRHLPAGPVPALQDRRLPRPCVARRLQVAAGTNVTTTLTDANGESRDAAPEDQRLRLGRR